MYKSILLPIDLAHEVESSKAVDVACQMADAFGAELHVGTVVPDMRAGVVSQFFPADFEKKAVEQAASDLAEFCKSHFGGRSVKQHMAVGQIYRQIGTMADKNGCDLIVMSSHHPDVTDILIGPNADQVMRSTTASVFIVRD
jgi:universal stress protein F